MKRDAAAFVSGAIFATGLCISGMSRPSKVLAFLDVAGAWDPSLAFVMMGALAVMALAWVATRGRTAPVLDARFHVPPRAGRIDGKLLAGAVLFGVGWGMSGICPGPAIVTLASGQVAAIVFVAAMVAGMGVYRLTQRGATPARTLG